MNSPTPTSLAEQVDTDGYFIWENFFDEKAINACRAELLGKLEEDKQRRAEKGHQESTFLYTDAGLTTTLTGAMHQIIFPSTVCSSFEQLWESVFKNETISEFMKWLTGENYRLRIEIGRRSTGVNDIVSDDALQLPHAWHRDSKGEFTFGFLLDDMVAENSGCTTVIPGTHRLPYDPRWDLHLSSNSLTLQNFLFDAEFLPLRTLPKSCWAGMKQNQKIREKYLPKRKDLSGPRGTLYFFLNDTWHGRAPNTSGQSLMLSRCGGFATDFRFKADRPLPASLLEKEDSTYIARYRADGCANRDSGSYFNRLMKIQQDNIDKQFELARLEKYSMIQQSMNAPSIDAHLVQRRLKRIVKRILK